MRKQKIKKLKKWAIVMHDHLLESYSPSMRLYSGEEMVRNIARTFPRVMDIEVVEVTITYKLPSPKKR